MRSPAGPPISSSTGVSSRSAVGGCAGCLSAAAWEAWICWVNPPLLTRSLSQPGYGHFTVRLLNFFLASIIDVDDVYDKNSQRKLCMRRNWIPKRERLESVPVQTWNTGFFCRVRSYNMFGCAFTTFSSKCMRKVCVLWSLCLVLIFGSAFFFVAF